MSAIRLDHAVIDKIAKRDLTLAGVTLTALSLMIGFYKDNLSEASVIVQTLFAAMIVFFVGSQFGYDAEHIWEARLSDGFQYFGTILLLSGFSVLAYQKFGGLMIVLSILGVVVIGVYLAKMIGSVWISPRKITKEGGDDERERTERKKD